MTPKNKALIRLAIVAFVERIPWIICTTLALVATGLLIRYAAIHLLT